MGKERGVSCPLVTAASSHMLQPRGNVGNEGGAIQARHIVHCDQVQDVEVSRCVASDSDNGLSPALA